MKKNLLIALSIFIFCFLFAKVDAQATDVGTNWEDSEGTDSNRDGLVTYNELHPWERYDLRKGYSSGGLLGYEMIHNLSDPYIVDIASNSNVNKRHYNAYCHRIRNYYNKIRHNRELYPTDTNQWYVTRVREGGDGVWYATVNCTTALHRHLVTPETIYYEGHRCVVDSIDLKNCYVRELTITDNITDIRKCQAPRLRAVYGGINVETIYPKAFMNDICLVNLPYFPALKKVNEFAFLGCLNLTEVLLPPDVEVLWWNAFGWMDCVLGNYDPEFGTTAYEEDPYYRTQGIYRELEKVEGITLYAAKDTVTYATLTELFAENDPKFNHVSYKEKDAYPGRVPDIDLGEDEEYVLVWIPPQASSEDDEWKDDTDISKPETRAEAFNALTEVQRSCMDWLEALYLNGEIDEDMLIALTGSLCGVNPIPRDFTAKHYQDEEFVLLQAESLHASQEFQKAYKAKQAGRLEEEKAVNEKLFEQRKNFLTYFQRDLEYMSGGGTKSNDPFAKSNPGIDKMKVLTSALGFANQYINYLNEGDSFESALRKAGYTTAYSEAAAGFLAANPIVAQYEAAIYFLFGNSKAGDAASLISTGQHLVEVMTDLIINPFYEAWDASRLFADDKKWEAFRMRWIQEEEAVIKKLKETQKAHYGQNIANFTYLFQVLVDGDMQREIFEGYVQQFADNTFYSNFMNDVYDVTVKNNRFGQFLYDYVVTFYSKEQDVLNKR